jgi:xanthine dehydrogenase accessory factor
VSDVERETLRRLDSGEPVVVATVIRTEGSPPSREGARLLVGAGGPLAGTLGCAEFDAAAVAVAPAVLESKRPAVHTFTHDLGSIEVHLNPLAARPVLLVLSATPVASHLLGWAGQLGFEPILVESRSERLEDFPAPERLVTSLTGLADLGGREICAVATDHDTPEMVPLLEEIARLKPAFVGVMGSRRHTGHHLEALLAHGLDPGVVAAIQTPVGIDIGASTPAEIALSILAGVVAMRNGGSVRWLDLESRQG